MKISKTKISKTIALIFLLNFNVYGYNSKTYLTELISNKDSILVFRSEIREVIKFDANKNTISKINKTTNYHIINFDTNRIILLFKRKGKDEWSNQLFEYYSIKKDNKTIEFNTKSNISQKVYLDINPYKSIVYSFTNGIILNFDNLKKITNKEFSKLGIYKFKNSLDTVNYSEQIVINELIQNIEYSEYWRKESFKKTINYIQQIMDKVSPKCKIVKRSFYNPSFVKYIGNQGFQVKLYVEYDCNQSYINPSYFWVNAYYLGYGEWYLELEDQKLTD